MNIFAKIIAGEIPCDKVLENENFIAFKDINPQAKIHVLIVPKINVKDFDEAPSSLLGDMCAFTQLVAKHLNMANGYRVVTNIGADGGQIVPHLHFHLLGGEKLKP